MWQTIPEDMRYKDLLVEYCRVMFPFCEGKKHQTLHKPHFNFLA